MPTPTNNTIQVGDVHITALTDGGITFDPRVLFPDTPIEAWAPFYDRFPEYFEGQYFRNNLGSFVFASGDQRILADTGLGRTETCSATRHPAGLSTTLSGTG